MIPGETVLQRVFAFGYVARIVCHFSCEVSDLSFLLCVFSLNTNSWKTKFKQGSNTLFTLYNPVKSVFVNAIAFWKCACPLTSNPNKSVDKVLYFDTLNETLGMIPFPQEGD